MIPIEKERQVRRLFREGLSRRKIAKQLKIDRGTVNMLAKLPVLRERKRPPAPLKKLKKPKRCKTCGGMIKFEECILCLPREINYNNDRPNKKERENEQVSFIWDVWELYKLNVIKHKLFMDLARRAKHILAKIRKSNAKKEKAAK